MPEDAWEGDVPPLVGGDEEDEVDPDSLTAAEHAEEFAELLMTLKHLGKRWSAKDVCILSYHASRAGEALEESKAWEMGKKPGRTVIYSRHLDAVLMPEGLGEGLDVVTCPTHCKYDGSRMYTPTHVLPFHIALSEEVAATPTLHENLDTWHESGCMPPGYHTSPVVQEHGKTVFPVAIFIDGVPFAKRDSAIGIWCHNMVSQDEGGRGKRHLCVVVRKAELCRCGCRGGWCTLFPLFLYINQCITAMGEGVCSLASDFGSGVTLAASSAAVAGTNLAAKLMVFLLKGDWAELGPTMCFPTFHHITWATEGAREGPRPPSLHHYLAGPTRKKQDQTCN